MLKRENRLKKNSEFKYVYGFGETYVNHWLVLRFIQTEKRIPAQIGFSVSKKLGGAVIRNRIKRQMRACVSPYISRLPEGFYIVFIARRGITNVSFERIYMAVTKLLRKARFL